jgi:hypothetical protein
MTRTPDLNATVDEYESAQRAVITTWKAQQASRIDRESMRRASSAALSTCATNWEWFRSDWHKKAIARNATVYRQALLAKVKGLLEQDPDVGRPLVKALDAEGVALDVHLLRTPTLSTVSRILDPSGGNVTFRSQRESDSIADKHLAPRYAMKVKSLTRDDWLIIGVMIAVRNALAHSSTRSVDAMNEAMQKAGNSGSRQVRALARTGNRVTRSGVGTYLRAKAPGTGTNTARAILICEHMLSLGLKFRV